MALKTRKSTVKGRTESQPSRREAASPHARSEGSRNAPARHEPTRALSPFEEMDLLFDRLSRGLMSRIGFPALGETGWPGMMQAPRIDLIDREGEIVVRAEIPGVTKDQLQVSLTDQSVTIRGDTQQDTSEEKGSYHRREISRGSFQRTLVLPCEVQGDQARASFRDGVLDLVLPKTRKTSARSVKID